MSRQLFFGLFALIFIASQSSCILFRKGRMSTPQKTDSTTIALPADTLKRDTVAVDDTKRKLIDILTPIWKEDIYFTTFSAKAKMHYEGKGQKHEFTTVFRIRKNEVIWASVTALGGIVQVARVYITPDSFKLINYLNKEVTEMSLADASRILPAPADFSILQNLVIGSALIKSGNATDAADVGNILSLQTEEDNVVQQINYSKTDTTITILQMRANAAGASSGILSFSDYQTINGRKFSMNRDINVVNGGEQHHLDMNFNKVEFDQPVDFPFSVPKNYKRN